MNHTDTGAARLHIRAAHAADRPAVVAMVRTIWNGEDYIPEVWDAWLADGSGALLVGEVGGQPVALAKISALGPGEDWFHGLRVDPARARQGFGRAMMQRCIALAHKRGARTLRYLTDSGNVTMHRMGREHGFRLVYEPAWYHAPRQPGGSLARPLAPTQIDRLQADLARSALLAHTGKLYTYGWHTFDMTAERLREHLAHGQVYALPGAAAWAIVTPREEAGWWLAHAEGPPGELEQLCRDLCAAASAPAWALRTLLPPAAPCMPALLAAGFAGPAEHMHVYELRLAEA